MGSYRIWQKANSLPLRRSDQRKTENAESKRETQNWEERKCRLESENEEEEEDER